MTGGGGSAEAVAARINQEQLFHELEQKYLLLKADYAVLEQERDGVVEQKSDVVAKLKQLQETVVERESEVVKAKEELLKLRTERDQLVFQVKTATSLADRRLNEVEDLQQTVKEQSKQLIESQRKEVEALQRAAEQETLVEPLRHNVNRLNKELEANKQHLEWMEKQLTEKTKLIQELRQTAAKATHDHEDLQVRHADEVASLRKQLESARQISKKLESSLVQAKEQMEEVQASRVHEEERLHNELSAQRRLADLYKESAEDANTRVNELQELCETLRRSLAESEDALAHQETRTKEKVEHIFREQAAASEQRIEALQDELKEAQSRLEELQRNKLYSLQTVSAVSELSTSAGAAHLAAHGLSPKELCDQILVLETALRAERDEKEQLKICMDRVVKEVHEKAPMLMGLKLDLERSVASNAQVSERLESCMQELVKCRARERQALVDKQSFERKCEALAKSVDDLSRQVQHLLFRAHENHANASIGESASENLVVFKDVEELQVRNQQLLMVIRELTDAKKKTRSADFGTDATGSAHLILSGESDVESDGEGESASETGKRLSVALKEIEDLRAEREEERQMIAAIVKQRDMYRILLAQADSKFSESSGAAASTRSASTESPAETGHPSRSSSADLTDSRALRELQNEFDTYKKEKQANMKMIQDALDQARSEATNFRLSQMQAEVEAKCSKDRLEASEKRRQDADEEVIRLRAKLDQVNTLLLQHQKLLANNEARLEAATTRLRSLEVEKDGALREVAFMKKNEEKVLHELTSLRLDNTNLLKLMDSSRQIESSREERERRESERLAQKLATLETKLQETYDKMESNEAVAGAKIAAEEQAKKIALAELNNAKEQLSEAREKLARVEEQAHAATTKCSLHEKEASLLREQLRKGASAAVAERVSALEVQLRQSQQEVQSSVEMKKSLTEAVAKYKAIAEANEKTLSELSAASEKWKAEMAEKLMAVEAERNAIQTELDRARAQIKQDVSEGNKLREEFDAMVMKHQSALKESQAKQRQLQIEADAARSELAALQEEASNLREDVASAQENYERELKLHASQVEKYSASRKQLQDEQKKSRALQGEVAELKTRISVAENEVAEKISSLEKLLKDSNLSQSSLTEQNKLLHTQLERANQQLRQAHESELRRTIEAPNGAVSLPPQQDHAKELEDLRSVISYLRKESEVLSSKHDLAHQENLRYRTQITMLESTVERLRDEMKRVEESSASAVHEAASVAAKENAKLEQLDLLRESNATLREECQKSLARVKAEEERVKNLEAQLGPLRNSESLLKVQIDSLKEEIIALTDANKRWKQRVEQLVEKYQQVDPAEYEKVCAEKASLTKELAELKTAEQTLRAELETLKSSEGKTVEEEKSKAENLRKQYDRIKGFAKTWKAKAEGLTKQVTEKTKEADDKAALVAELEKKLSQCNTDKSALEAKLASVESAKSDEAGVNASWEKERQEMKDKADAEAKRVVTLREMNSKLLNGLKTLKQENSQLKLQLSATATQSVPDNTTTTTSIPGNDAPKLPASSVSEPSAPLASSSSVSQPKPDEPKEPVILAKSPVRSPSQPPAAVSTLKTVTSSAPVVSSVIPSSATSAVPAQVPAAAVEAKPEVVAPTPAAAATAPAPSSEPTSATTSVPTTTPATAAAAPPVSAEEKLRLFALQSMKKQFQKVGGDSGAKPTGLTPAKPMQPPVVAPAAAKPPLPSVGANVTGEEEKPSASSGPFLKLSPPSGTFGAFGSGGASGLVFGKPGITLPIPASPTPVTTLAAATSNTATTITTNFNVTSSATSSASQTTTESTTTTVVSGETEAQRRSQRLARFAAASASTAEVSATLKRPATAAPETTAATPQKIAKLSGSATSAPVADSQETEEEFPSQACADDSEATEDEPTQAPSPSPLAQTE